jgi:hypothetical protein
MKKKWDDDDIQRLVEDWIAPLVLLALVIWMVIKLS